VTYRPLQPKIVPCRSCKAPIFFAQILSSGKPIPIDFAPVPDGNLVTVDPAGRQVQVLAPSEIAGYPGHKYQPHFRSCPDAKSWRRKRGIPEPPAAEEPRDAR
jgi:hypothetical protein